MAIPVSKSVREFAAAIAALICLGAGGPALAAAAGPFPIWWPPVLELDSPDDDERLYKTVNERTRTTLGGYCSGLGYAEICEGLISPADEAPYPIWWSDILELDSLDDVERRLERTLWKNSDDYMELYKTVGGTTKMVTANDCRSLKTLSEDGYEAEGRTNRAIQHVHLARCRAIELLGRSRPAKRSFLRKFFLDYSLVDDLPAPINGPSCESMCRQIFANEKGVPWSDFEPTGEVDRIDANRKDVTIRAYVTRLRIVGRADVDGDGLEDIILMTRFGVEYQPWCNARIFVLTRESPSAVLRILEPERYRCADYQCKPAYVLPARPQ